MLVVQIHQFDLIFGEHNLFFSVHDEGEIPEVGGVGLGKLVILSNRKFSGSFYMLALTHLFKTGYQLYPRRPTFYHVLNYKTLMVLVMTMTIKKNHLSWMCIL